MKCTASDMCDEPIQWVMDALKALDKIQTPEQRQDVGIGYGKYCQNFVAYSNMLLWQVSAGFQALAMPLHHLAQSCLSDLAPVLKALQSAKIMVDPAVERCGLLRNCEGYSYTCTVAIQRYPNIMVIYGHGSCQEHACRCQVASWQTWQYSLPYHVFYS